MTWLWKAYVAVLSILVVAYFLLPSSTLTDSLHGLVGIASVAGILAGIAVHRPATPMPWYLMALGQGAWVVGDVAYTVEQLAPGEASFPASSDIAYLGSYPLMGWAVLLLIRTQRRERDVAGLVDSLIVTAGFGLLSWSFIAGPIMQDSSLSTLGSIVAVAYPAGDIVILAMLIRLMTGQGNWTPSFKLLVAATLPVLVADTGLAASLTHPEFIASLDLLWLSSYVLWAAAALHPDMATLASPIGRGSAPFTRRRLVILTGVVMLPLALYIVRETTGLDVHLGALLSGAALLSLLVMVRMAYDIEEIRLTTTQRDRLQDDLFRRATQDDVTGLANRRSLAQLVEAALERSAGRDSPPALVVIELGGVAEVVRQHGHAHGDTALIGVANRLTEAAGPGDQVGRLAPHQFGVLVEQLRPETDLAQLAHDLLAVCRSPLTVNGQSVTLSARAGVVVGSTASADPEVMLRDATLAMASAGGDDQVEFFDATLRAEVLHRDEIEVALSDALRGDQLAVHYQPILDLRSGELSGYEALVRWSRPGHGMTPPDSFVPIAEKSDLICELDRWMLAAGTAQLVAWTRDDPARCAHLSLAVNVSGRSLAGAAIVDDVAAALRTSGLEPSRLTLEITETVLVDLPRAIDQMLALRTLGVRLSIDDFGTGYTSIGQLGQLPVDTIKVDRGLVTSTKDGAHELLALIVQVGHASGLRVVAEGIEHVEQLTTVTNLHYDLAQGYLIGRPAAARV
jgi:diguanylate cyclase (GGDEF)-like protein